MIHLTFCSGLRRSGSTWSYNVARLLMQFVAQSRQSAFYASYHDGENLDKMIRLAMRRRAGFYVVKSHLPGPLAMQAIAKGKAWNIVTYRDPRDVLVSLHDFKGWSIEDGVRAILHEMPYIETFWKHDRSLKLRYEDMKEDPKVEIRKIAQFLRVQVDDVFVERLHEHTSTDTARKISESLPALQGDAVRQEEDHLVHREQLLHTGHVLDGAVGKWRTRLDERQQAFVGEHLASSVQLLGYPAG